MKTIIIQVNLTILNEYEVELPKWWGKKTVKISQIVLVVGKGKATINSSSFPLHNDTGRKIWDFKLKVAILKNTNKTVIDNRINTLQKVGKKWVLSINNPVDVP
jgi:hypothetical protein